MLNRFLNTIPWFLIAFSGVQGVELLEWKPLPELPSELGVAGPFTGVHNDTLIVAGGANFPEPVWENPKVWHDTIYTLTLDPDGKWKQAGKLPRAIGYGACVSVPEGVICIGGNDEDQVYGNAFILKSDGTLVNLPSLPEPNCYGAAAVLGDFVYLTGGTRQLSLDTATKTFLRLNWKGPSAKWEKLPTWQGAARAFHSLVAQHNGKSDCLYLLGGRYEDENGQVVVSQDVWEFNPDSGWRQRSSMPVGLSAGTTAAIGQSHIFTLSGDDGANFGRADELKDKHPGFLKEIYVYHTITDTWIQDGKMPANQVTTQAIPYKDGVILASGEVRPRVRTKAVWQIVPKKREARMPAVNWIAISLYLSVVLGVGIFFSKRNKNTEDFFRGGQRIPGWVAGLSIFATLLSSITFVALPAKAYATDWTFILINVGILICAPFVAFWILPKYRKINATSAYQYLENRFNLGIRLFAAFSFILFQIGRMAIVMYLPALALAAATPLSLNTCILIMGLMSVIYCSLGGLEAVVWTDAIQAIVLLGGALVSFSLIIFNLEGGWQDYIEIAQIDSKFHWANFDWSASSYMTASFWVLLLGGIGSSLIPYSSDQAVVQRYVSTSSAEKARYALWLNSCLVVVATFLFFGLGTALYIYYKANPASLDPILKTDSIFPMFISRELPAGVAGFVIAAIFAAAQSTISTSMNSTAAVIITDFYRRLGWKGSESQYLKLARFWTIVLGMLGTMFALILAVGNIESAWQTFLTVVGFVLGPICGIFLLGMFTQTGNSSGAIAGTFCGVASLVLTKYGTETHSLLYGPIGISSAFLAGYLFSKFLPDIRSNPSHVSS
jgi:SSS family solute:Na+ symporter